MRRLFWTFPAALPGAGLLILRIVTGSALLDRFSTALSGAPPLEAGWLLLVLLAAPGVLVVAGLWTPIAAALLAGAELWSAWADPANRLTHILMATMGAALALVGPGAWSADAYLFGWKRIDIGERRHDPNAP